MARTVSDYETVGDAPIEFNGNQEGGVVVMAHKADSINFPSCRVHVIVAEGDVMKAHDAIAASLTLDQADDLISRLAKAKKLVLDAADHTVERTDKSGGDLYRLVQSSLGRWGVGFHDGGGGQGEGSAAWRFDWYDTEAEARSEHADAIEHEICEGCDALVPAADAVYAGDDVHLCETCAEDAREEARTTPARHCDPTSCDFAGMISDCENEDDSLLCPKCGEYMEPADAEPVEVLGEIAEPVSEEERTP